MKIAVLGATGALGRAVVDRALAGGHEVVGTSRRASASTAARLVVADVTTGAGLADAFAGAAAVIDATNDASPAGAAVLVDGTRRVLEAAAAAGVAHFVGISIVGIDDAPIAYYRVKVAQERVIAETPVPWSLVRATQFHGLVERWVAGRLGVVTVPRGWTLQPIDVREVAAVLVAAAAAPPAGRMPDVGGPEVVPVTELARQWKRAKHRRRLIVGVPVPGKLGAFLRSGKMCCPDRAVGTITYERWLAGTA
jgi:uncharacterized protein YbjT (DUF2867 family)